MTDATIATFSDKTAFGVNEKYGKITDNNEIETEQFLKACVDMTTIVARLGTGFIPPKKDMQGNIKKIQDKFKIDPTKYSTLNSLLKEASRELKDTSKAPNYAAALLWLKRTLEFIKCFIASLSSDWHSGEEEQNLRQIILHAYQTTLQPFHGRMTQFVFSNVSRFAPYRKEFLSTLMTKDDATVEMVVSDIDLFLPNLEENIRCLNEQLVEHSLDNNDKTI